MLAGQPKFDEPLIKAWGRTLRRYRINYDSSRGLAEQFRAAEQLRPLIMQGKKQSARFTEIFAAAPVWLLQFTGVVMDARVLKFDLPDMPGYRGVLMPVRRRRRLGAAALGHADRRRSHYRLLAANMASVFLRCKGTLAIPFKLLRIDFLATRQRKFLAPAIP